MLGSKAGFLHKKATRIATSSPTVAQLLRNRRCVRNHVHQHVIGGKQITSHAGHYPRAMAATLLAGIEQQFDKDVGSAHETFAVEDGGEEESFGIDQPFRGPNSDSEDDDLPAEKNSVKVSAAMKATIKRLHESTGHRSGKRLGRALAVCGAPEEAIIAAKAHKCDICLERAPPKLRRPVSLPRPKDFNDQCHIDLLECYDINDEKYFAVHMTDFSTRFQLGAIIPNKSSHEVIKFVKTRWCAMFVAECDGA